MARFRATIKGARGDASRLGDAASGLTTTTNGWHVGVRVDAFTDRDADHFHIYLTHGSGKGGPDVFLGRARLLNGTPVFEPNPPPEGRVVDARANEPPAREADLEAIVEAYLAAHDAEQDAGPCECIECGEARRALRAGQESA
jgi:hypothetical protein